MYRKFLPYIAAQLSNPSILSVLERLAKQKSPKNSHASSSVSGGCGVPLGEFNHSICRNFRLTSRSLSWFRVNFFFFLALNFISLVSSVPLLTALAEALDTTLLARLLPGRLLSSNRSAMSGCRPL